jgi:hypothetical protein
MAKKCPPGVFCIENYTIFAIFCICFVIACYLFIRKPKTSQSSPTTIVKENVLMPTMTSPFVRANPNIAFSDQRGDVLLNPYAPPVNDERYMVPSLDVRGGPPPYGVPINIRTQGVDATYRQVGILTDQNGKEQILALMGRPLLTNRDKWQYYTMSERNNIKLPVSVKGKSCMNEYGCDKIYDGDSVYIEGYGGIFKATIYDNNVMRYIPFF